MSINSEVKVSTGEAKESLYEMRRDTCICTLRYNNLSPPSKVWGLSSLYIKFYFLVQAIYTIWMISQNKNRKPLPLKHLTKSKLYTGSIAALIFSSVKPCGDISAHNFNISSLTSSPSEVTTSFSFGKTLSTK